MRQVPYGSDNCPQPTTPAQQALTFAVPADGFYVAGSGKECYCVAVAGGKIIREERGDFYEMGTWHSWSHLELQYYPTTLTAQELERRIQTVRHLMQ